MAEKWVKVVAAPNETEALLIEGLLDEVGIPSLIQRARGFDVPDFLSAGPRDVLVPDSSVKDATRVLESSAGLGSY